MNKCFIITSCIVFWVIIITGCVLFALSFSIVELEEYGIIYDHNTQTIESKPFNSGRYFTGLGREFIIYPRQFKTIEFSNDGDSEEESLSCWTYDGLTIWLDISFHFSLRKEKLKEFYYQFGENWVSSIVRIAMSTFKDISTTFTTKQFFDNRSLISQKFSEELQIRFDKLTKQAVKLENLQLRSIKFDEQYEASIVKKLIQQQQQQTIQITQDILVINKTIEYTNANAKNQVQFIYEDERAKQSVTIEKKKTEKFLEQIKAITAAYKDVFAKILAFNSNALKLQYIYANEIGNLGSLNTKVFLNVGRPLIEN